MSISHGPPASWSAILEDAVSKPGMISEAYSRFWNYSVGNQLLALFECFSRRIEPGPINTYLAWQKLGRHVKKGEKAITLCMPVACKSRRAIGSDCEEKEETFTRFVYRPNWFVLSQTEGNPYKPQALPEWSENHALEFLGITRISFDLLDGNCQGFAQRRSVAISPIAVAPHKTLFHELGHVVLGHTSESQMVDDDRTPRNIREVEAECVALICIESLRLSGSEFSRGYVQKWLRSEKISEKSAHRIFKAADRILRAGRPAEVETAVTEQ